MGPKFLKPLKALPGRGERGKAKRNYEQLPKITAIGRVLLTLTWVHSFTQKFMKHQLYAEHCAKPRKQTEGSDKTEFSHGAKSAERND